MSETVESVRFAGDIGFFMCGNDLFDLNIPMCEKLVYIALCRYAGSNNRAWPAYNTLAGNASCSKRRAIQAVKKLCSCGLVKKEQRGNRTNVYIIYPAASFKPCFKPCAEPPPEPQDVDDQGAHSSPPPPGGVQQLHSEGANPALSGCKSCTLRVQPLHPKRNKKNNNEKNSSSSSGGEGSEVGSEEREKYIQREKIQTEMIKTEIPKTPSSGGVGSGVSSEEREKYIQREMIKTEKPKTAAAEDLEQVRQAFRSKKVVVKDSLIKDLLQKHDTDEICGAIRATDFDLSRNPINVIRWMLRENSYCMPLSPAAYSELHNHDPFSDYSLQEEDRDSVKQMIRDAKNNLLRRTAMDPVTPF